MLLPSIKSTAIFSEDKLYRYQLSRLWDIHDPVVNWIMLNPSTADEFQDDPTVAKTQKFAKQWGYGKVIVTNIFAYRATDPKDMKACAEPVGAENDDYIEKAALESDLIVCAWGNHGEYLNRSKQVLDRLLNLPVDNIALWCLNVNKSGQPQHPLYVSLKTQLKCYYGYGNPQLPVITGY